MSAAAAASSMILGRMVASFLDWMMVRGAGRAQGRFAVMPRFLLDLGGRARLRELAVHDQLEEPRYEENGEEGRREHAAHHAGARGMARAGAGTGRDRERHHAEDE